MLFLRKFLLLLFVLVSFSIESSEIFDCQVLTEKYARKYSIPNKLLTSISFVESGIKKNNIYISWPWTLNVDGKSKYFKNKDDTLIFLKNNVSKNDNIDVGCMQISLKFHRKKFDNLEQVLDPENNVRYAANYLRNLYKTHKTWNEAVSRYHSSVPKRKRRYLKKVHAFWSKLRQRKLPTIVEKKDSDIQKIEFFRREFEKSSYM